jgi:hypothetical protein
VLPTDRKADYLKTILTADSRRIGAICLIAVGALLLFASVTNGFTSKYVTLQFVQNRQTYSLIIGALSFAAGIVLLITGQAEAQGTVPAELTTSVSARIANLGGGQKKLFLTVRYGRAVLLPDISRVFGSPENEVYWRLEALRLLGLLNRENVNAGSRFPLWKYSLTAEAAEFVAADTS